MTSPIHKIGCSCGNVKGEVVASVPLNRVICYCKDCRAFATFLGGGTILDAHGGTEIVQLSASRVTFSQGTEHLSAVRLTNKGMLRYYAQCCDTPIGNLLPNYKMDFVGLIHSCIDKQFVDTHFGPVRGHLNTKSATGVNAPNEAGLLSVISTTARMIIRGLLTGAYRRSAFLTESYAPVGQLRVLSEHELHELKSAT